MIKRYKVCNNLLYERPNSKSQKFKVIRTSQLFVVTELNWNPEFFNQWHGKNPKTFKENKNDKATIAQQTI